MSLLINKRLYGLDHLRAIAIILVFLFHYGRLFPHPQWTNTISKFGWTGVDLFFVLSGYLIASQLFKSIGQGKSISLNAFFIKRFFRVIPVYLFVVALYFLLPAIREKEALAPLWKFLTFTQNLNLDAQFKGTFSHAWSLCIEEQFYLFFPLILLALLYFKVFKKGYLLLLALFLFGFLIRLYSWQNLVIPFSENDNFIVYWYKWIYYPTYCRLDGLLIGVSIAALFQFKPKFSRQIARYGNLILLMSLLVLTAAYFLCMEEYSFGASIFGFPLVDLGYGLMVLGAISPSSCLYQLNSRSTVGLATLSYSTYLTHKIVIHVTQEQFSKFDIDKESNLMFFLCVIFSIIIAYLLNNAIEKPFLKLRDRVLKNKKNGVLLNTV